MSSKKCGLFSAEGLLPIQSVDVFCAVRSDFACQVSVTQVFKVIDLGSPGTSVKFVDTDGDTIGFSLQGTKVIETVTPKRSWQRPERLKVRRLSYDCNTGKYEDDGGHGTVPADKRLEVASKLKWFFQTADQDHMFTMENEPTDLAPYSPPKKMVESRYMFPLDGNSAVYGFKATLEDGSVVEAEVQEKQQARQTYVKATSEGKTAFLLEREQSDIFQMTVGNIGAGETVKIEISYVAELEMRDGDIRIRIPNHIAPKCGGGPSTSVDYPISFDFSVRTSTAIGKIDTRGGTYEIEMDDGNDIKDRNYARFKVSKEGYMDYDLVLTVSQENPYGVYTTLERSSQLKSECLRLTWNDKISTDTAIEGPCEIIFLVDKSGSMRGPRMETTKFALQLFLRSLPENSKFNIIMFDSRHKKCFPNSVAYNDDTIERAQEFVSATDAGGGTNIAYPLREVLEVDEDDAYPRSVILLTDGEVSDTRACIDIARNSGCRVFTIGVGTSFSQELVEGIAKASDASWLAVHDTKDMGNTVIQMLSSCLAPMVTKCSADMGPYTNSTMWPDKFPKLFPGSRETLYWTRPMTEEGSEALPAQFPINLSGFFSNGDKFDKTLNVITDDFEGITESQVGRSKSEVDTIIHRVAAMSRIKKLEKGRQSDSVKKEILELGLKYNLATKETSFVAVRRSLEDKEGEVMTVKEKEPDYNYYSVEDSYAPRLTRSAHRSANRLRTCSAQSSHSYSRRSRTRGIEADEEPMMAFMSAGAQSFQSYSSAPPPRSYGSYQYGPLNTSSYDSFQYSADAKVECSASSVMLPQMHTRGLTRSVDEGRRVSRERARKSKKKSSNYSKTTSKAATTSETTTFTFEWLLSQQSASGQFKFYLEPQYEKYGASKALSQLKTIENIQEVEAVFITLLGLYLLSVEFADRKSEWQLVYKKSENWVAKRIEQSSKTVAELLALFG